MPRNKKAKRSGEREELQRGKRKRGGGVAGVDERGTNSIWVMTSQIHIQATLRQMYTVHRASLLYANYTSKKLCKTNGCKRIFTGYAPYIQFMMENTHRHTHTMASIDSETDTLRTPLKRTVLLFPPLFSPSPPPLSFKEKKTIKSIIPLTK